jgi:hypothetical protein
MDADIDAMLTMTPRPALNISRAWACAQKKTPDRFTSMTRRQFCASRSSAGEP